MFRSILERNCTVYTRLKLKLYNFRHSLFDPTKYKKVKYVMVANIKNLCLQVCRQVLKSVERCHMEKQFRIMLPPRGTSGFPKTFLTNLVKPFGQLQIASKFIYRYIYMYIVRIYNRRTLIFRFLTPSMVLFHEFQIRFYLQR